MIRVSDLVQQSSALRSLSPLQPLGGAQALNPSSWFDGDGLSAGARIGVELSSSCRGLSVAQHAERVLTPLCGEPDAPGR